MKQYFTIVTHNCVITYEKTSKRIVEEYKDGTKNIIPFPDAPTALYEFKKMITNK